MTHQELHDLIDLVNKRDIHNHIQIRKLTNSVKYAKIWRKDASPHHFRMDLLPPTSAYFINCESDLIIGVVIDMYSNLHWYLKKEYRKKGYLTRNLKNVILKHIFQNCDQRSVQKITIDFDETDFLKSENVALSVGFKKEEETIVNGKSKQVYRLYKEEYLQSVDNDIIIGFDSKLSSQRIEELAKEINYLSYVLWRIKTEINMHYGASYLTEDLLELSDQLKSKYSEIESLNLD